MVVVEMHLSKYQSSTYYRVNRPLASIIYMALKDVIIGGSSIVTFQKLANWPPRTASQPPTLSANFLYVRGDP